MNWCYELGGPHECGDVVEWSHSLVSHTFIVVVDQITFIQIIHYNLQVMSVQCMDVVTSHLSPPNTFIIIIGPIFFSTTFLPLTLYLNLEIISTIKWLSLKYIFFFNRNSHTRVRQCVVGHVHRHPSILKILYL